MAGCRGPTKPEASRADLESRLEGISPGETRDMGDASAMTMHRMQVDARDVDGWQAADSTLGGFSVELPIPYNDLRIVATEDHGTTVFSDTVGGKTSGQLAWSATCIRRSDGTLGPKAPPPGTDERTTLGSPVAAHTRNVVFDDASCVLTVEAQGEAPLPDQADIDRFLGSLRRD